jgi:hypothetical protein
MENELEKTNPHIDVARLEEEKTQKIVNELEHQEQEMVKVADPLIGQAFRVKVEGIEEVVIIESVGATVKGEIASGPRAGTSVKLPPRELLVTLK